jgi:uroporphyrin-3 C-methyltransferase
MTDQNTTEEKQPEVRRTNWINGVIFFFTLAIVIFLCAFGYGYFELSKVNIELARRVSDLQARADDNQNEMKALQKSVTDMQQIAQKSQAVSTQQEQVMSEWRAAQKGDLDKWQVAEAQYLTKLADVHLQLAHNIPIAILLLQQADRALQNLQDPKVLEIRKSLVSDIANVQAIPQVDVTSLYLRLSALNEQINKLPLPINPLTADQQQNPTSPISKELPWWKAGLEYTWQGLNKIVIVRKNPSGSLPLVLPEEKMFLYQNLHAQMENAMWALLHHNANVYQASLMRASAWTQQYFAQDAQETKTMLQNIEEVRKVNIQPTATNLANTLQTLDRYFAQVKAGQ